MGRGWEILFEEFVIYSSGNVIVTFGSLTLVLIVLFYVIYKVVGS